MKQNKRPPATDEKFHAACMYKLTKLIERHNLYAQFSKFG